MKGTVKKDGTSWYYVIDLGKDASGKRRQKKKRGFATKKEAEQACALAIAEVTNGTYVEPSKVLYKEFLHEWLQGKKNNLKPQTFEIYTAIAQSHIIPELGSVQVSKLSAMMLQRFVNDLCGQGLSGAYVNKILNIVRGSLDKAKKLGIISVLPTDLIEKPRISKREMEVWDFEEMTQFLSTAKSDRLYIAFLLALTTGLRQGEILGLRWADIDLEAQTLCVRQTLRHDGKELQSGAKTKSSARVVRLPQELIEALPKHRTNVLKEKIRAGESYAAFDLVVCTKVGTPITPRNLSRTWYRLVEQSGVKPIRFHDLRHTHATLLIKQGVHFKIVAERLGHGDTRMTLDIYSHVLPSMQEEASKAIDSLFACKKSV